MFKIYYLNLKTNLDEVYVKKIPLDGALINSSKGKLKNFESVVDVWLC